MDLVFIMGIFLNGGSGGIRTHGPSLVMRTFLPLNYTPKRSVSKSISGVLSWTIICLGSPSLATSSGNYCLAPPRGYVRCMLPYKAWFLKPCVQPLPDLLAKPSAV